MKGKMMSHVTSQKHASPPCITLGSAVYSNKKAIKPMMNNRMQEIVHSSYGYTCGYAPKSVARQIAILRKHFPNLVTAVLDSAQRELPLYAEGWFVIPRWERVASTYEGAIQKVLALLKEQKKGLFFNCLVGKLGSNYLRESDKTRKLMHAVSYEQHMSDMLIMPAQFGFRYRGYSVRRARESMNDTEAGLSTFAVAIMLLTHPARLMRSHTLWVACAGDEYVSTPSKDFSKVPVFDFGDFELGLGVDDIFDADEFGGSASFFLTAK